MSLEYFNKFVPKEQILTPAKFVWTYTRVSTKDQFDTNHSIDNQIEQAKKYAAQNGYTIAEEFGSTYESGKNDFTRTEFKKLITDVRKAKKKPLAIMIFKMSRFSRSGSSAIGLLHELIHNLGVHLIEVSTGKNTFTPRGETEIIESLIHAHKENLERAEIIRPGLERFIREGNRLGKAPRGYDHLGSRVKDPTRHSPTQQLLINAEGKLLARAWKWKLEEQEDHQIISKLAIDGLAISKQSLSAMWRKPFYCGINTNRFCDKAVQGNWKPLVSQSDFKKINDRLEGKRSGYTQSKIAPERPLQAILTCGNCSGKLTGYQKIKSQNVYHYYKCQTKGCCSDMNANTSRISQGLNDKFVEKLTEISLPDGLTELFKQQMTLTISALNQDKLNTESSIQKQIDENQKKQDNLEEKYLFGTTVSEETYQKFKLKLNDELRDLEQQLPNTHEELSNLENLIASSVDFAKNMSKYWISANVEVKTRLLKLLFPNGLVIDPKNRTYRTNSINTLFVCIADIVRDSAKKVKDPTGKNPIESSLVAGAGLEPTTFGL